ncbi:hypothetical protein Y032_1072g3538 [Ancylostoma ceylanicum]|uniref:Uncharacterized protein n=1 Tax=Ancylostoma ceylanicum TaxID=53326 RepID=A0A016W6U5_9BILA|nr:hypothetical protein Y032_1072g3538 [Ancylostoma ceylanicum]
MAESTRVSPEELERREKYLRAGLREVNLMDPFTWSYPMKDFFTPIKCFVRDLRLAISIIGHHQHTSGPGLTVYRKQLFSDFFHDGQFIFDLKLSIKC